MSYRDSNNNLRLYKDDFNRTLYPVCNYEKNSYKVYNAYEELLNNISKAEYEGRSTKKLYRQKGQLEEIIAILEHYVFDGLVYATYQNGNKLKQYI